MINDQILKNDNNFSEIWDGKFIILPKTFLKSSNKILIIFKNLYRNDG